MGKIFRKILALFLLSITSCAAVNIKSSVDLTPPPDMLLLMQAKKMLDMGNLETAEKYVNKFVALFPDHANYCYVLYLKGEIALKRGKYFSAYQYFLMAKKFTHDRNLLKTINKKLLFLEDLLKLKSYADLLP